jgi:hypothetical protein
MQRCEEVTEIERWTENSTIHYSLCAPQRRKGRRKKKQNKMHLVLFYEL